MSAYVYDLEAARRLIRLAQERPIPPAAAHAYMTGALCDAVDEIVRLHAALLEACEIAHQAIEDNAAAMPTAASQRIAELRKIVHIFAATYDPAD